MKKILCFVIMLALLSFSVCIVGAEVQEETDYLQYYSNGKYEQYFTHYWHYFNGVGVDMVEDVPGPVYILRDYGYEELFEFFSSDSSNNAESSTDEAAPDYVLVKGIDSWEEGRMCVQLYGDYVVKTDKTNVALYHPFYDENGYYIIIPGDDLHYRTEREVIALRDAHDEGIVDISAVFEEYGLGYLIGDANNDRVLNVKDATEIQKCVAGLVSFADYDCLFSDDFTPEAGAPHYVTDFNRDGQRNVRDATAIQKKIAGLL